MTSEKALQTKVKKLLLNRGAYCLKIVGSPYLPIGTPDMLACYKGVFLGLEFKVGKNKPTPVQLENLRKIEEAGGVASVIRETEEIERILSRIDKETGKGFPGAKISIEKSTRPWFW